MTTFIIPQFLLELAANISLSPTYKHAPELPAWN